MAAPEIIILPPISDKNNERFKYKLCFTGNNLVVKMYETMYGAPAIQLRELLYLIRDGKAASLNGTARSLHRKIGTLGRIVGLDKQEIETAVMQAYEHAGKSAERINMGANDPNYQGSAFPKNPEVEYAK